MKKILTIFTALMLSFTLLILSAPKVYASINPQTDSIYKFQARSETIAGVSFNIDADTQIWTINGTATDQVLSPDLINLFTANTLGYALDVTKSYYAVYEYISGTYTQHTISSFRPLFNAKIVDSTMTINGANAHKSQIAFTIPKNSLLASDTMQINLNGASSAYPQWQDYKFKIQVYEFDTVSDFNFFNLNSTFTASGVSLTTTTNNTLLLNGATAVVDTVFSFDSLMNTEQIDVEKDYIVKVKYLSGSLSGTSTGFSYNPAYLLNDKVIKYTQHTHDFALFISGANIVNLDFLVHGVTPQTLTYTNYTLQYSIEAYGVEPVAPGETTTPPTGLFLSGSTYEGQIYYNRNESLDLALYTAYNISTTTGNIFDLSVISAEQIIFTLASTDVKFIASYIDPQAQPDTVSIDGPGDVAISIVGDNIQIEHLIDSVVNDSWSFLTSGFQEFYILIEKETIPINYYHSGEIVDTGLGVVGELLSDPNMTFTNPGYIFLGWGSLTGTLWNFESDILVSGTELNLYTQWVESHTVTFDKNDGTAVTTQEVENGAQATLPTTPVRAGYDFQFWGLTAEAITPYEFTTPITSDITLYAIWLDNGATVYTVTFVSNGGSAVASQEVEEGNLPLEPTDPLRSGYTFAGWFTDISLLTEFTFTGTGLGSNLTLYAKWTANTGGTPIEVDSEATAIPWLYIGIGAVVLIAFAGSKKKKRG